MTDTQWQTQQDEYMPPSAKTDTAKCSSCGADLTFNPTNQTLMCEHCGAEYNFETAGNDEQSFSKLLKDDNTWANETKVFTCISCGSKQVVSNKQIVKECSFCGASNVVETSELSGLKPNAIVPFSITDSDANSRAVRWVKKRFFAPNRFKKHINPQDIKGLYCPAFTFDTQTLSIYRGRLGKYYTETRRVNGKTQSVRKIRYYSISGTYSMMFDDILIQASSSITQKTVDGLQPFNTNSAKAYQSEYLHGFCATQYTKSGTECWEEAKQVIYAKVKKSILSQYTYDVVDFINVKTECNKITYKYLLLPIYVGHFSYKKKNYNFYVSGVNGKVVGKTPISALKILGVIGLSLAIVGAIIAMVLLL